MLRPLPRLVPADPGRPDLADDRRPIREVTRQVAFEPGGWFPERAARVAALFDDLAPGWNERPSAGRFEAVDDALARGGPFPAGTSLEVGSGTGVVTSRLAEHLSPLVAVDLSAGMLAHAPTRTMRVRADASALPVAAGTAAVVALVNMFLFPHEVARVLVPHGVLLWVNTLGDATPIHLSASDVEAALPGGWDGVHSSAGWGTWAAFRRASAP
ncbi:MAG TPA: class I SAM-dependent methyltransferase [Acidimicrobiales bacterium]|nr:class I SAM-dependent methyltransferase [Acidimicrobiales bacterium]